MSRRSRERANARPGSKTQSRKTTATMATSQNAARTLTICLEMRMKWMKLRDWANATFGDCAPKNDVTLRRWARDGIQSED